MSLGQDDGPFTSAPLPHSSTKHIEDPSNTAATVSDPMDTDPIGYNDADPDRRLRAAAPPPESSASEKGSGIQLGSNNPFRASDTTSAERSVTFAQVPDDTMDQGNSSLVPAALGLDSVSQLFRDNAKCLTVMPLPFLGRRTNTNSARARRRRFASSPQRFPVREPSGWVCKRHDRWRHGRCYSRRDGRYG